jgi:hypothetical protein
MASFLSESYLKPKLIESRLVNKIMEQENNKITFEKKAILYIKNLFLQHWKIIIVVLVIIGLFYWRYKEIQNIRNKNNKTNETTVFTKSYYSRDQYENDSEYETSEDRH